MKEKITGITMAFFAITSVSSLIIFTGCVVYEPVLASTSAVSSFDRSWNAAIAAAQDVGVRIQSEDRARGVITGANDSRNVTITVSTQADGRVRVEISARGPQGGDTNLANDISSAYDRRMGR
jgi:hypothetical protein